MPALVKPKKHPVTVHACMTNCWLDQGESIFSKVQRDLLTPSDFPSFVALERDLAAYFAELNTHPKPIKWMYTKTKLLAKFEAPPPLQLAA